MKKQPSRILAWFKKSPWVFVTVICLLLAGWCVDYLEDAKKPWEVQAQMEERAEVGKPPSLKQYIHWGTWLGLALTTAILAFFGCTARWWFSLKTVVLKQSLFASRNTFHGFGLVLIVITVLAIFPRWERLDLSFWTDENWAFSSYVWGEFTETEEGALSFHSHTWKRILFANKQANNHVLHSLLQKGALNLWAMMMGSRPDRFDERVARFPAFLAGVLSISLLGILLRRMGYPAAGIIAALFFALHPWHIRYSAEARGYSLYVFFLLAALWALLNALERGQWRFWILFAVMQASALMAFIGGIYALCFLNGAIVFVLFRYRREREYFYQQGMRWLSVNAFSAGGYLTLMLPALAQMKRHVETSGLFNWKMSWAHYQDLWAQFITGAAWHRNHSDNYAEAAIEDVFGGISLMMGITGLILVGFLAVLMRHRTPGLLLFLPFAALLAAFFHNVSSGRAFLPQYFIAYFPFAVMALALLLDQLGEWVSGKITIHTSKLEYNFKSVPVIFFFLLCVYLFWPKTTTLLNYPLEDFRGAVEKTRLPHGDPYGIENSQVVVVSLWRSWESYDPRLIFNVRTGEGLKALINQVRAAGKELYVVVGHRQLAQQLNQDFLDVVEDEALFESLGVLWGQNMRCTLFPYRLKKVLSN